MLSERTELRFLILFLLLTLGYIVFSAIGAVHAVQSFREQYSAVRTGDVRSVRAWMTPHVIAHIYHIPENYVYHSLDIEKPVLVEHDETLGDIANGKHQPVERVVYMVQRAILRYRHSSHEIFVPQAVASCVLPLLGRLGY